MTEKIKMNIENKMLTMGMFIDPSIAFDLMKHLTLFDKRFLYGIKVQLELIGSFLTNRS